jgi:hypothetical protein
MPDSIPPEAVTAMAWVVVANALVLTGLLSAYSARLLRKWSQRDR